MLTGLTWLGYPVFGYVVSRLVDNLRQRKFVSTTLLRKIVDGWGKLLPMGLLLLLVFEPEGGEGMVMGVYVLTVALVICEGNTWQANIVDVSARHTGLVSSVAQVFSLTASFCLPPLVAALTPRNTDEEWQTCLLVMLVTVLVSYLIYIYWGSSEPQLWDSNIEKLLLEDQNEEDVKKKLVEEGDTRNLSDRE